MTEPLKATLVLASISRICSSTEGEGRTTPLSFEGVGLGVTGACSASVSCRNSQSEKTEAASRAAERRDMKVAMVRMVVISERVGDAAVGWCFVNSDVAFSRVGDVSLK